MYRTVVFSLVLASLLACCTAGTYVNPIVNVDAPDPGVMYDEETQAYYMATTSQAAPDTFPIRRSYDLANWQVVGAVFPASSPHPVWSSGRDYWAPELHRIHGKYYSVFTGRDKFGRLCNGLAVSQKGVLGPYIDFGSCFIRNDSMGYIDSHLFHDKETNLTWYLWKDDANDIPLKYTPMWIQQIDLNTLRLIGQKTFLIQNELPWEDNLVEAPWLVKHDGYYYLFYSASHFYDGHYCMGVARSKSILGPYVKKQTQFVHTNTAKWIGPGHCSVLETASKRAWALVYHSWELGHVAGPGDPRVVLLDEVVWGTDGWPYVKGDTPSIDEQQIPK